MRLAARDAEMFGEDYHQVRIVLEPEAASLVIRQQETRIRHLPAGFV